MMGRLVIYGAGGFGRETATTARCDHREIMFLSDSPVDESLRGCVIARDQVLPDDDVVIAVASSAIRRKLWVHFARFGMVVAPTAVLGEGIEIGEGAIVRDYSFLSGSARIGRHFHGNLYCDVSHDCVIGDFVTFAPRVCCNGNIEIGDGAYIGAGALLRNGQPGRPLRIGRNAIVGMGAVVTRDVPDQAVVYGNPARIVRYQPVDDGDVE